MFIRAWGGLNWDSPGDAPPRAKLGRVTSTVHPATTSPPLLGMLTLPGSDDAWAIFIDRYGPLIERRCLRAEMQAADAEDVRATLRMRLVEAMKGFRDDPARSLRSARS